MTRTGLEARTKAFCRCCHKPRTRRKNGCWRGAHNWCGTCTTRWYAAGKPPEGPPPRAGEAQRIAAIRDTCRQAQEARIEDYAFLRRSGESQETAAARVGVSTRTARRVYERTSISARGEAA